MHITQAISVHLTGQSAGHYWAQGSAGVDIFFVISGFVMGLSTPPAAATLAARARQAGQFLLRRLLRVVPGALRGAVHLGLSEPLAVGLLTALLVVLCACLSYALLERPTTLSLQRGLSRQRPPAATPSTSPDHSASRPFTHAP